jgi:hypothetical protein
MSPLATAAAAIAEQARTPVTHFAALAADDQTALTRPPFRELMAALARATPEDLAEGLGILAPALDVPDLYQASRVAMACGMLVEHGGAPAIAGPRVLARLTEQLAACARLAATLPEDEEVTLEMLARAHQDQPAEVSAWQGHGFMVRAAMAMLARDRALRVAARGIAALAGPAQALAERSQYASYIDDVLGMADDLSLVVLHLGERRGFRVLADAVRNNFHLFSLLHAELIGPGRLAGEPADPRVAAVAHGRYPDEELSDHERWGVHDATGIQADGTTGGVAGLLWGEASPYTIPVVDGVRVILLGRPLFGARSWDVNLIASPHDALCPHATVVEELPREAVEAWMARLVAARG